MKMFLKKSLLISGFLLGLIILASAQAQVSLELCTKFVSIETGGGKEGSMEKPAKDLGNIISRLEPNDVVCIAEGIYTGRGDNGVDDIEIPVSVIGGFSTDFKTRDPWGTHKTIFTGIHNSDNFETQTRLSIDTTDWATKLKEARGEPTEHTIIVDGLIFDNGPRNYYKGDTEAMIVRQGTPSDTPTPESGALSISTGVNSKVIVQNNIAINFAPTEGVFSFFPGRAADVTIYNNVAANNTGAGFRLGTSFTGDEVPLYKFSNNISVFNEKHDAFGTYGGSGIMLESSSKAEISNSIFAYNDNYGVDNAKRSPDLVLNNNIIAANANADYIEFDMKMNYDEVEDESDLIWEASDNTNMTPSFAISEDWGAFYVSRNVIDRNAAEEEVQAVDAWYNDVRSFFGWNTLAEDLNVDSPVWLPRMSLDDVFKIALLYEDQYGVYQPAVETY